MLRYFKLCDVDLVQLVFVHDDLVCEESVDVRFNEGLHDIDRVRTMLRNTRVMCSSVRLRVTSLKQRKQQWMNPSM